MTRSVPHVDSLPTMTITLLNAVILAEDFAVVRNWWAAALGGSRPRTTD